MDAGAALGYEFIIIADHGNADYAINPDGTPKETTNGLNRDYITAFSYGKVETLNLFIPRKLKLPQMQI